MQGLWSSHRRTKINLNSPSASLPTTPGIEASTAATEELEPPLNPPETQTTLPGSDLPPSAKQIVASTSDPASPAAAKRKTRLTRTEDSKRAKINSSSIPGPNAIAKDYTPPATRLSDLGGVDACVEKVLELIAMPLCHPEVYLHTGVQPPRGVLLHGPPGCGKTLLANAIAGVSGHPWFHLLSISSFIGTRCTLLKHRSALHSVWHVW
jgi:ribosome biogenesis ATPase